MTVITLFFSSKQTVKRGHSEFLRIIPMLKVKLEVYSKISDKSALLLPNNQVS